MSEMNAETAGPQNSSLGDEIVGRINQLAAISETPEHLARIFLTTEHRAAAELILGWMRRGRNARASRCDRQCLRPLRRRAAGLAVPDAGLALRHRPRRRQMGRPARADHGDFLRRRSAQERAAIAVRDRGDRLRRRGGGPLCLDAARQPRGRRNLRRERAGGQRTSAGISMRDALVAFGLDPDHIGAAARARSELLAYVELHIEQGPVLEARKPAGRRRDRDRRRDAAGGETDRHGRPCRHRADAAAARCAGRCRGMHRRD